MNVVFFEGGVDGSSFRVNRFDQEYACFTQSPSLFLGFITYVKCLTKLSSAIVFQCTETGLNISAISSTMSSFAKLHFPPHSFNRFNITDKNCLEYGRKINGEVLRSVTLVLISLGFYWVYRLRW